MSAEGSKGIGNRFAKSSRGIAIAKEIGSRKHSRGRPGTAADGNSESSGQGNSAGFPTQYPEKIPSLNYADVDGSQVIDIDLSNMFSHVTRMRLTGNPTITFSGVPPPSKAMKIYFEITQDGTGGRTISWPIGMLPTPTLNDGVNAKTLITMITTDQGITWHTHVYGSSGSGGGDNLGDHIAIQALLMQDNAIFFDTPQLKSIISLGNAINYVNDISSAGSHDFFVDDLVTPKLKITETDIEINEDMLLHRKEIVDVSRVKFDTTDDKKIFGGVTKLIYTSDGDHDFVIGVNSVFELKDSPREILLNENTIVDGLFTVADPASSGNLQIYNLFGKQHISATDELLLEISTSERLGIDNLIRAKVGIDLEDNSIFNVRTLQIPENFPANTAPSAVTDTPVLFSRPNGTTGKTELRVKFQTGVSILIQSEL